MANSEKNIVHQKDRIFYVEPNDIYGNVGGVPLTPDYSDYCISVNLIAEIVTRYRQSGEDKTMALTVSYSGAPGEESSNKWVSFLQGEDAKIFGGEGNFLTTYYTDIDYDDIVKKNIVEGLGIESIQISFESYYTPTVVIKFIDVRGSSLFGREEAVHESGEELSSSSVFGAFFTIPYPKFKLQVKGFYGHGVTYQLTCSNFKASFNSQTGNFEAVATFIGYSYSLLTDIPLRYLVAAPYCKYVGEKYWEEHLNTPAWALSGGEKPMKLFELIHKIKSLLNDNKINEKLMTDEQTEIKNNISNEKAQLTTLATTFKAYIEALKGLNKTSSSLPIIRGEEENDEQLLIFSPSQENEVTDELILTSQAFIDAFDTYNSSNNGKAFSNSLLPNSSHSVFEANRKIIFGKLCTVAKTDNKITSVTFNCTEQSSEGIKTIELNNNNKPSDTSAQCLFNDSHPKESDIKSYFADYCYLVNLNKFLDKINERIENLNKEDKEINKQIAEKVQEKAAFVLGFTPYIGDIFKIIMCHLETFIKILWECYNNIDKSDRSPGYLNVPLESTDFVNLDKNKGQIGAWPGLFNNGKKTDQGGDEDKSIEYLAWVGDFSHNFEEEKVIIELYKAIKKIAPDKPLEPKPFTMVAGLPVMPNDINNMDTVFSRTIENNISSLAGYLSFRAAQIFGILLKEKASTELANSFGKMDAYNFFTCLQSRSELKNTYINAASGNSLENILNGVSKCSNEFDSFCTNTYQETGKSRHSFETVYSIDKSYNNRERHPLFKDDGSNLKYIHYYTNNKVGLVPDTLILYKGYSDIFEYKHKDNDSYFLFKRKEDTSSTNEFLHKSSCKALFTDIGEVDEDKEDLYKVDKYINDDMFNVIVNPEVSNSVKKKYDEIKSGTFTIYGDEFTDDFSNVLEKLWHVEDSDYGAFFNGNTSMLSKPFTDFDIKEEELYPLMKDRTNDEKAPSSIDNENLFNIDGKTITYSVNDGNGKWIDESNNEYSLSNLTVRNFRVVFPKSNGYGEQDLFGDPFYYLQNDKLDSYKFETIDSDRKLRQKRAKAILFLHTLNYDLSKIPQFLKNTKKSGGIYSLPYGYILLLGGLLWRDNFIKDKEKNVDPIQSGIHGYKKVGDDNTLFVKLNDGQYRMCALMDSDDKNYNITVSSLFGGGKDWKPDYHITNKLISLFLKFVDNEWGIIMSNLELKSIIKGHTTDYECVHFKDDVITFKGDIEKVLMRPNDLYLTDFEKRIKRVAWTLYRLRVKYFNNFFDNYRYIWVKKEYRNGDGRGLMLLLNENDNVIQNVIKGLYTKKVIVCDSSGYYYTYDENSGNNEITISNDVFNAYLSGFCSKIEDIANNEKSDTNDEYGETDVTVKRDIELSMYLYLKILWDRWLVSTTNKKLSNGRIISYQDYYNVENFYNSFIFIDAFYLNIYKKLLINCESLKRSYDGRDEDGTLFQFIGDITKDHHCLFLALPDYVDMGNAKAEKAINSMQNMFRPIPYSEMNDVESENRFVIIYSPRMSENPTSDNGYREDYFRVWNPVTNDFDKKMPTAFTNTPVTENSDLVSRYGYYVPSFGVAFSRQNNHIFKNINLDMSTPLVTSASINALSRISQIGSANPHKVAFMGQDLYPVYSNYSYICEIEMMGDAQIQPLMYFQLMNVPMWSGVYMIFNVTHTISAGTMTTRFKGMKLSRNPVPYSSSWFVFNPDVSTYDPYENSEEENNYNDGLNIGAGEYDNGDISYAGLADYEIEFSDGQQPPLATPTTACKGVNRAQMKEYYILRCMSFFVKNGLTIAQAGGIVGNFMAEGLPCFAQKRRLDPASCDSNAWAFGLSQMNTCGVFPSYKNFCSRNGLDWRAVQPQLQFILEIIRGNEPKDHRDKAYNKLTSDFKNSSITYSDAAKSFAHNYERCTECGYKGDGQYQPRVNNAKTAIDLYNRKKASFDKGTTGTGVPLLVGDSWAVGMTPYFKKQTGGISEAITGSEVGSAFEYTEGVIKSAAGQIKDSMSKKPKYILLYSGLNSTVNGKRSDEVLERMFNDCCDNANGTRIYICSICYVGSNVSDRDVNRVNTIISKVCGKKSNAVHIKMDRSEMENFRNTYCKNSLHPNAAGYEKLYQTIFSKMNM